MTEFTERRLLTTKEAAYRLRCSAWKLRELVHAGKVPYVPLGDDDHTWRYDIRDLDQFIESRKIRTLTQCRTK